jgi:hypothetical protein
LTLEQSIKDDGVELGPGSARACVAQGAGSPSYSEKFCSGNRRNRMIGGEFKRKMLQRGNYPAALDCGGELERVLLRLVWCGAKFSFA